MFYGQTSWNMFIPTSQEIYTHTVKPQFSVSKGAAKSKCYIQETVSQGTTFSFRWHPDMKKVWEAPHITILCKHITMYKSNSAAARVCVARLFATEHAPHVASVRTVRCPQGPEANLLMFAELWGLGTLARAGLVDSQYSSSSSWLPESPSTPSPPRVIAAASWHISPSSWQHARCM